MVWKKGNNILEEFMTFNLMRKNVIVDFYIWCNEAVIDKYLLTSVSNVSRINIENWTTYWDLWSKWYILHVIQVLHTIAHDSSVLKHEKLLHMILIQYITVWNIIVIYKYTCTLIHNCAFTQHTHIIFSEKFHITIALCVVQLKTCVTLTYIWHFPLIDNENNWGKTLKCHSQHLPQVFAYYCLLTK